jgi:hypothetical protein
MARKASEIDLLGPRFLFFLVFLLPDVNSHCNHGSQSGEAEPAENDAGNDHASAADAQRLAADLAEREMAKNNRGDRADSVHPKGSGDKAADSQPAGTPGREKQRRRVRVE